MRFLLKILAFIVVFTAAFLFFKSVQSGFISSEALLADLTGLSYLYSSVSIIFAIFAAFVIYTEAERWGNLVNALKDEVASIKEFWYWSKHLPPELRASVNTHLSNYLKNIIDGGWEKGEGVSKSQDAERTLTFLHADLYSVLTTAPALMPSMFSIFSSIMKHRENRIHHISYHVPSVLKYTVLFSDILLIGLSFFIIVQNVYLDYLFMLAVGLLGFMIYALVDDLDNPTRPGGWHITTKDYEELLKTIKGTV